MTCQIHRERNTARQAACSILKHDSVTVVSSVLQGCKYFKDNEIMIETSGDFKWLAKMFNI